MAHANLLSRELDNQDGGRSEVLRKTVPFIILATLSVIGRYWARNFRKASLGADDYMILPALVSLMSPLFAGLWILMLDTYIALSLDLHMGRFCCRRCW